MNKGENFRDHLRLFNELNIHLVLKKYNWSDLFPNIKHDKIKPLKKKHTIGLSNLVIQYLVKVHN
jgi:hypothetical protein